MIAICPRASHRDASINRYDICHCAASRPEGWISGQHQNPHPRLLQGKARTDYCDALISMAPKDPDGLVITVCEQG